MSSRDDASVTSSTTTAPRGWRWPFWLGAIVLAFAVAKIPLSGLDIWWHLRTGEALALTSGWLATDSFSWTASGADWAYKDIGADLLLYLGHRLLGDASLSLWPGLAVLGIGASFYAPEARVSAARESTALGGICGGVGWRWALLLLAATVAAMQHRLHARPMLFSHVAFAWLMVWLPRLQPTLGKRAPTTSTVALLRAPVAVTALLWAWAWLHRGALIGAVVVWAWALAWTVAWVFARVQRPSTHHHKQGMSPGQLVVWPAWLAAVASTGALFATPNGAAIITTVVKALGRTDYVEAVDEWAPISASTLVREHGSWLLLLLAALLGGSAVARAFLRNAAAPGRIAAGAQPTTDASVQLAAANVRPPIAPTLGQTTGVLTLVVLALGLSVVASGASRWIPYAAMAAAHALAATWRSLPPGHRLAWTTASHLRRLPILLSLVCLLWISVRGGVAAPGTLAANRFPTAALAFARTHQLPAKVINSYDMGGFILWRGRPHLRTEIDGRADMVFAPKPFRRILRSHSDPKLFAEYRQRDGATWVLGHNRPGDGRFAFLPRDRRWCLAHWSAPARVWLARSAHQGLCAKVAYQVFTGPSLDATAFAVGRSRKPAMFQRATTELARMIEVSPDDPRPRIAQVVLQHGIGDRARRDWLLGKLIERFGDDPGVLALLRRLAN